MSQRNQSKQRHADLLLPGYLGGHNGVPKPGEIYSLQHVVGLPRGLLMVGHAVSTSSRRFPKAILVFALQPIRLTNPSEQFHSFSLCPELVATGEGQERRSPSKSTALLTFFTTTDCGFDQYTRLPTLMFKVCIKLSSSKSFYLTI